MLHKPSWRQAVGFTMVLERAVCPQSSFSSQPRLLGLQHVCLTASRWQVPICSTVSCMNPSSDSNIVPVPLHPGREGDTAQCHQFCLPVEVASRSGCSFPQDSALATGGQAAGWQNCLHMPCWAAGQEPAGHGRRLGNATGNPHRK